MHPSWHVPRYPPPSTRYRFKKENPVTTQQQESVEVPAGPVAPEAVNHLVLNVKDMHRSHEFWTRIMGFRQVGEITGRPNLPGFWMRFYQGATGNHHDLALSQVADPDAVADPDKPWSII